MMSQLADTNLSCSPSLKLSSTRPPGDGKEEALFIKYENYRQKSYDNMVLNIGKSNLQPSCGDGKEISPPSSATLPYVRWNEGLHHLLADECGIKLFLRYLEQEDYGKNGLQFWLACEGISKNWPNINTNVFKLIYKRFVVSLSEIHHRTKKEIAERIESGDMQDGRLFDNARREVEDVMRRTTYPNFLQSDLYIQHVQTMEAERSLQRDSVLEEPVCSGDECAKDISKDGHTPCVNFSSVKNGSQEALDILPTLYEDQEFEPSVPDKGITLTSEVLNKRFSSFALKARPESEAGHYLKANTPGYNITCYSKYSAYLPPSAQDSELQSLSSDALTDDSSSIVERCITDKLSLPRNRCQGTKTEKHHRSSKPPPYELLNADRLSSHLGPPKPQGFDRSCRGKDFTSVEFREEVIKEVLKVIQEREIQEKLEEEEQPQSILDDHVSRVWDGSAQQTPNSITPPAIQPYLDLNARQQAPPFSLMNNIPERDMPYGYPYNHCKKTHANPLYQSGRHRRDADTYSCDSGAVSDCVLNMEPALINGQSSQSFASDPRHGDPMSSAEYRKQMKQQMKRSSGKKIPVYDPHTSIDTDSGVGLTNFSSSNGTGTTQQNMKKSLMNNSSMNPVNSKTQWNFAPQQAGGVFESTVVCHSSYAYAMSSGKPRPQDQNMPPLLSPSAEVTIDEAKRRLEGNPAYYRQKVNRSVSASRDRNAYDVTKNTNPRSFVKGFESQDDSTLHNRKQGRKSYPNMMQNNIMPTTEEMSKPESQIRVAYCFGNGTTPYMSKLNGKNMTLKQFKSLISKKGNFKYFFKTTSEEFGVVLEEVTEDHEVLPLYEGKIFSVIETVEEVK